MFYLISKITLCLIIAAVFGFIFGWLFKLFFTKNNIKTDLEECLRKYKDMEKENLDLLNKIQKLQLDNKKITDTKSKLAKKTTPKIAKDDLKKIRGIGTILETRLNKLGVFNFAQIATLT
jgi:predicted flap endonuclease-1-like 5' DNA nuclease